MSKLNRISLPGIAVTCTRTGWVRRLVGLVFLFLVVWVGNGSAQPFQRQDTLRGSITAERVWWDLQFYHLDVKVEPERKKMSGTNLIRYQVLTSHQQIQIDLQPPMVIHRVTQDGSDLAFKRDGNAWFVRLIKPQTPGNTEELLVYYSGTPKEAVRPPWEGGVQWTKDSLDNWFIATSCQGIGASVWWPCKDHMYDEPDSMRISVNVPAGLKGISNGRLLGVDEKGDGSATFHWVVKSPINNYGVNLNIGNYIGWDETFEGEKGMLDIRYYVLPYSLEKAKVQFQQVPMMLKAFEHWFGPYPFYRDGYKLVEVPYLGMEHQSSVTYGNQFANGYLGRDLSGTGWGLKFDFIIIHESGHEWFANNITYRDIADMWIHESFTSYSESLYLEYHFGKKAAADYIIGTRQIIQNQARIMGVFGVNQRGSGDMYPKGANMLHTIRQIVDSDSLWRAMLRGMNERFYHKTVTGSDIVDYMNRASGRDLSNVFKQYLEDVRIPELEYTFKDGALHYRWNKVLPGFDMPVRVTIDGRETWLHPVGGSWNKLATTATDMAISPDFYITARQFTP